MLRVEFNWTTEHVAARAGGMVLASNVRSKIWPLVGYPK